MEPGMTPSPLFFFGETLDAFVEEFVIGSCGI
jgi:hypothetical protein